MSWYFGPNSREKHQTKIVDSVLGIADSMCWQRAICSHQDWYFWDQLLVERETDQTRSQTTVEFRYPDEIPSLFRLLFFKNDIQCIVQGPFPPKAKLFLTEITIRTAPSISRTLFELFVCKYRSRRTLLRERYRCLLHVYIAKLSQPTFSHLYFGSLFTWCACRSLLFCAK